MPLRRDFVAAGPTATVRKRPAWPGELRGAWDRRSSAKAGNCEPVRGVPAESVPAACTNSTESAGADSISGDENSGQRCGEDEPDENPHLQIAPHPYQEVRRPGRRNQPRMILFLRVSETVERRGRIEDVRDGQPRIRIDDDVLRLAAARSHARIY